VISVIVATHNRRELLERTVSALKAQEYAAGQLEIVVVDNASTDGSPDAVARLARQAGGHPVRLLHESRPGKSYAVNTGVAQASGDLLLFTDDDVLPSPGWAAAIASAMEETGADFCAGRIQPLWGAEPPAWLSPALYGVLAIPDNGPHRALIRRGVNEHLMPIGANMAVRRQVLDGLGGWRPELGKLQQTLRSGEDHEFFLRMLHAGLTGVYEPRALVAHLVPADRLQKRYFVRWLHDNGQIVAGIERAYPPAVAFLFGVPRYLWREALRDAVRLAGTLRPGRDAERFARTTRLAWFAGYLRGAWAPHSTPGTSGPAAAAVNGPAAARLEEPR
jgi:glycosyltransferase involved in cell wall biosynthesis